MRVDADDALLFPSILEQMLRLAKINSFDAVYPNYIDEASKSIKNGNDTHHAGGCLFATREIRKIQFTENLRGWEGRDLFERASNQLKIGYFDELPAFFYRDTKGSLSKTNLAYRSAIKERLDAGLTGAALVPEYSGC